MTRLKQLTTGPSRSRAGLAKQRQDASERAAFRRAGMRRTHTGGKRQRFTSTNDQNNYSKTAITSYPSQSAYAKDMLPSKEKERMYGDGVRKTQDRALYLRRLHRQLRTTRTRRGVHNVDVLPKGDFKKNDSKELISRGKEYHQAVREIPKEVKKSGGSKGDKIVGKAAEVMIGSKDPEKGRRSRRNLYSRTLGATKWDPVTRVQVAQVKEYKTFSQFIEEAKRYQSSGDDSHKVMHDPDTGVTFTSFKGDKDTHHVSFDSDENADAKTRRRNALHARSMGKEFIEKHPKGSTIEISPNNEKLRRIYVKHGFSDTHPFMRLKR
jgi:hypothetical protein